MNSNLTGVVGAILVIALNHWGLGEHKVRPYISISNTKGNSGRHYQTTYKTNSSSFNTGPIIETIGYFPNNQNKEKLLI